MKKIAILLFAALILTGCEEEAIKDFSIYITENQIYKIGFEEKSLPQVLDSDGSFETPVISKDGKYIAYTKNDGLFICLPQNKSVENIKIDEGTISYDWLDNDILVYSGNEGGVLYFNALTNERGVYVENKVFYERILTSFDKIYLGEQNGIFVFDVTNSTMDLVIAAQKGTRETGDIGLSPEIAGIAKDGSYLYIWRKPTSASLTADGVLMAAYDAGAKTYIPFDNNKVFALAYDDNIAPYPQSGAIIALNNGVGRGMNENKSVGMVNFLALTFQPITHPPLVTMTPSFSTDGKKLLFSASPQNPNIEDWEAQNKQHIYVAEVESGRITELTNTPSFDFKPCYVKDDREIVFLRREGDKMSLILKKGNNEKLIGENVLFTRDYYYYGHYDTKKVLATFTAD